MTTAFTTIVDGVKLDELVGGYGVAEAALAAMDRKGWNLEQPGGDSRLRLHGRRNRAVPGPSRFGSWESPTSTAL